MKNKLLFVAALLCVGLALTACHKKTEITAQNVSQSELKNNYQPEQASMLEGDWKAIMQIQKTKLHVVLHIAKQVDGSLLATLDSPDQYVSGLPANAIEFTPPNVKIQWQKIGGIFDGALENGKLPGTWQQGNAKIPLVFDQINN